MSFVDSQNSKRIVRLSVMVAGGVVLAACGSGGSADTAGDSGTSVVTSTENSDLGTILVNADGRTVYFSDQEASGDVLCVDECLQFWIPVVADDSATTTGVDGIGVVKRPDNNQQQVAYQGKPLYTFRQDHAEGDATGDNVKDDFGDTTFRWHAVVLAGSGKAPQQDDSGDGGYGGGGY
jgi:predicted lipoprotein with Yx(FWY)xxD motif